MKIFAPHNCRLVVWRMLSVAATNFIAPLAIALNASIQPSDSTETLSISKPMTTSVYGPSTIGL